MSYVHGCHLVAFLLCCFFLQLHPMPCSIATVDPVPCDMLSCCNTKLQRLRNQHLKKEAFWHLCLIMMLFFVHMHRNQFTLEVNYLRRLGNRMAEVPGGSFSWLVLVSCLALLTICSRTELACKQKTSSQKNVCQMCKWCLFVWRAVHQGTFWAIASSIEHVHARSVLTENKCQTIWLYIWAYMDFL